MATVVPTRTQSEERLQRVKDRLASMRLQREALASEKWRVENALADTQTDIELLEHEQDVLEKRVARDTAMADGKNVVEAQTIGPLLFARPEAVEPLECV